MDRASALRPTPRPSEKEKNAAEKTMREIETDRRIEGLFYRKP